MDPGHDEHSVEPKTDAKVPVSHGEQGGTPVAEKYPGGQPSVRTHIKYYTVLPKPRTFLNFIKNITIMCLFLCMNYHPIFFILFSWKRVLKLYIDLSSFTRFGKWS